jgi:diguanylate cyclase (GGDEF)-like protein
MIEPMETRMTDRRLALCVAAAVAAVLCGVACVMMSEPVLGAVAGALGGIAGAMGVWSGITRVRATQELETALKNNSRLRRELDALSQTYVDEVKPAGARTVVPSARERAEHAFDPATGLYDERYFAVLVQQQVAAARRSLRPISVVIFELDTLADAPGPERDQALTVVGDVVRRTLRESDSACRLGDVMVGVILEDTPEAGGVWAAERVRGTLLASPIGDALTVSAGVACYPSHALGAAELVQQAGRALEEARRHGVDRVEVAPEA